MGIGSPTNRWAGMLLRECQSCQGFWGFAAAERQFTSLKFANKAEILNC